MIRIAFNRMSDMSLGNAAGGAKRDLHIHPCLVERFGDVKEVRRCSEDVFPPLRISSQVLQVFSEDQAINALLRISNRK